MPLISMPSSKNRWRVRLLFRCCDSTWSLTLRLRRRVVPTNLFRKVCMKILSTALADLMVFGRDRVSPRPAPPDVKRFCENWQDEVDSAAEYRAFGAVEPDPEIAEVYSNLACMEEAHINFWEDRLRAAGAHLDARRPSCRSRILSWMARRFGPETVLSTNRCQRNGRPERLCRSGRDPRDSDERPGTWHALVLGKLVETQPHGLSGNFLSRLEGRHRAVGGSALRGVRASSSRRAAEAPACPHIGGRSNSKPGESQRIKRGNPTARKQARLLAEAELRNLFRG